MTALSERQDLTLDGSRRILLDALGDAGKKPSRGHPAGHYGDSCTS
jgi:hypothetical protein